MMQIADIIFYLTGLVTLTCALMVILTKDIFRAALFLAATFLGVVALFILLFA
jgi:NADH:ubiquinone oxidoreductase subunit 6 (subunit J)